MSIAIVSLLVILAVVVIGVPVLARVFGEAANRNENTPEGEDDEKAGRENDEGGPGSR